MKNTFRRSLRKGFIALTLTAMVAGSFHAAGASVAHAEQLTVYADDFESTAIGALPGGWIASGTESAGNALGVAQDTPSKSLTLTQNGKGEADETLSYAFASPVTGLLSVDMKVKADQGGAPNDFLVLKDSTGAQALGLLFADDWQNDGSKKLSVRTKAGWMDMTDYEPGQWYAIHADIDVKAQTFTVTVNGQAVDNGTNVAFLNPAKDIAAWEAATYKSKAGTFHIDDVAFAQPDNQPPSAADVAIAGSAVVGQTLQGGYTYSDAEGDAEGQSSFQWYIGTKADGSDKQPIANATGLTYEPQAADGSKYVFFEVVPAAATGAAAGQAALSAPVQIPLPDVDQIFTGADIAPTVSAGSYVPVKYADSVSLSGSVDNWQPYESLALPSAPEQNKINGWTGSDDLSAKVYYAYNAANFYLAVNVTDDVHNPLPGGSNWSADGVQFAFGEGAARSEYGAALGNDGKADIQRYADGAAVLPASAIQMNFTKSGHNVLYEFAIPWGAAKSAAPSPGDKVPFTVLVNDNDGAGRDGYVEWTGGIGSSKDVTLLGTLDLLQPSQSVDAWISGADKVVSGSAVQFALYVANKGSAQQDVTIDLPAANIVKQAVSIPADGLLKKTFTVNVNQTADIAATVQGNGLSLTATHHVIANKTAAEVKAMLDDIPATVIPRLDAKMNQAAAKKIPTDYEKVNQTVIENTFQYGLEDIEHGQLARAQYIADALMKLDADAEASLDAYLSGKKKPGDPVSRYQTGRTSIDGYSIVGNTTEGKKKPIIFSGYGMFEKVREDIPLFPDYGTNLIDFNIYPSDIIKKPGLGDWSTYSGDDGTKHDFKIDRTVAHGGANSAQITGPAENAAILFQTPALKPNTTYTMTAWIKGDAQSYLFTNHNGWTTSEAIPASADWQQHTFSFTTSATESTLQVGVFTSSAGTVWVDDYSLTEDGQTANLMSNPGFELGAGSDGDYAIDNSWLDNNLVPALKSAEANNVAVTIELAPQGFPDWVFQQYPDTKIPDNYGFLKVDIENPRVLDLMKADIKAIMTKVKGSKSLQAINLSNESEYITNNGVYNLKQWHAYLPTVYKTVAAMNAMYGTAYASFNDVPIPDMANVTPNALYYDYLTYKTARLTAFHKALADEIHKYDPTMPVHVKLMGFGVTNNDLMLRGGKDLEQMAQISGMTGIDGGPEYGGGPNKFTEYLGMLDMITSMKEQPTYNSENHVISDGENRYEPDIATWISNWIWDGALHGTSASSLWVWQRDYTTDYLAGSILNRPDAIAEVGHATLDLNRLVDEVTAFQNDQAQVGLLYSMTPRLYSGDYYSALTKAYGALSSTGEKTGFVTENQITDGGLKRYKVLVLPEVNNLSADALAAIAKWEDKGGQLVLIGDSAKLIKADGHNQPLPAKDRSAIMSSKRTTLIPANPKPEDLRVTFFALVKQAGLANVIVYDANTNQPASDVEWRTVKEKGKTLLSLVNYGNAPKTVYVQVNGKTVVPKAELISDTSNAAVNIALGGNGHLLFRLP